MSMALINSSYTESKCKPMICSSVLFAFRPADRLPAGCHTILAGDSIIRQCIPNNSTTLCFPGATLLSFGNSFIDSFDTGYYDFTVKFVILHVGTNNLQRSCWERDSKDFSYLYHLVRERFRYAVVIFSAIIPRWDCDDLYERSLHYNRNLEQLSRKLQDCLFFDATELFIDDDSFYKLDGLHLNNLGAEQFTAALDDFLANELLRRELYQVKKSLRPNSWIPSELKKLYPTKKKVKPKRRKRRNLHNRVLEHEREQKPLYYGAPKCRKWTLNHVDREDGFRDPVHPLRLVEETISLPPNRHIPEYVAQILIPYVQYPRTQYFKPTTSSVNLPNSCNSYVKRKLKEQRRQRTQRRQRKRRKRKRVGQMIFNV